MKITVKKICCPRCGEKNTWRKDNPAKPFCSERCKLIDLGGWADESHCIPGDEPAPDANYTDENPGDDYNNK